MDSDFALVEFLAAVSLIVVPLVSILHYIVVFGALSMGSSFSHFMNVPIG